MWSSMLLAACLLATQWSEGANPPADRLASAFVDPLERVDCGPEPNVSADTCTARGCIWGPTSTPADQGVPWCYFPRQTGYFVSPDDASVWKKSPSSPPNPFGSDAPTIRFKQTALGAGVRLTIDTEGSFVPDIPLNLSPTIQSDEQLVVRVRNTTVASFSVERASSGLRIFDTSIGGLLFGDKYIQLSTFIPAKNIFGFGEHIHQTIRHDLSGYRTWPMFARDKAPNSADGRTENLYGVHNFYVAIEDDGKAHGVFLLNSNAQEVVTGPGPHLTYRAIGGRFDFFFLPGPTPAQVVQQYQQIIGRPYLPAYWALGYQFCRWGYASLDDLKATIGRIQNAQIPLDVVFADIDYMERYKDFTTGSANWSAFAAYADDLHQKEMKVTLIFDPAVQVDYDSFQRAVDQNANFISWPAAAYVDHEIQDEYPLAKDTNFMLSVVWPDKHVAFPDFYDDTNQTADWWVGEFDLYHKSMAFDGIWIDMNEPSSFGTNKEHCCGGILDHPDIKSLHCPLTGDDAVWEYPPYMTWSAYHYGDVPLSEDTVCMIGVVNRGKQRVFDTKSLYGLRETISTARAMKEVLGKRGQLISRSTFASSGHYGGHWLGDNNARWEDLRTAIIGAQEFNIFGIPHVGSDVCGFDGDTNEELCLRWQQLGAFHSFFRNHNIIGAIPQDPSQWNSVAQATRTANLWRYRHLPYLYSLHFAASKEGGTVIRPVAFEFPRDRRAFDLSYQFMWGPAVMVIPVTDENVDTVDGYLPEEAAWFALYGSRYGVQAAAGDGTFEAPRNSSAPAFVRAGHVLPRQVPALTTAAARRQHFQLLIACDETRTATGRLFWDDGERLIDETQWTSAQAYRFEFAFAYTAAGATLNISMLESPQPRLTLPPVEEVEVLGYAAAPAFQSATVNGAPAQLSASESSYSGITRVLRLRRSDRGFVQLDDHLPLWTVQWNNV
ncbi:Maltase-glucoamylase, intestinal [Aphelenchoides fujianensis]|nr:Maltase-glucoamylase, intestinal [Aphelenchoides fujianensis]